MAWSQNHEMVHTVSGIHSMHDVMFSPCISLPGSLQAYLFHQNSYDDRRDMHSKFNLSDYYIPDYYTVVVRFALES